MAIYYVDFVLGDDTVNGGTSPTDAWKNDPDWATAAGAAADDAGGVVLANGDFIYHRQHASGLLMYPGFTSYGFKPRTGINNVTRETYSTDYAANGPAIYSWLQTHTATGDWTETSPGSNLWDYNGLPTGGPKVQRLWIGGVAQQAAPSLATVSATQPFYGHTADQFRVYSVGNPYTNWDTSGGQVGVFEFSLHNGSFYSPLWMEDTKETQGISFTNFVFYGGYNAVEIEGGHSNVTVTGVDAYKFSRNGMRTNCTVFEPNKYNKFVNCNTYRDTHTGELDKSQSAYGDGFVIKGPSIGCEITGCHSQDNNHTAYTIESWSGGSGDGKFGCHANLIDNCTADNRNSIYGRAFGIGGSRTSYPSTYNVISRFTATNMQTYSGLSGYRNRVEWCNISGNTGSNVANGIDYTPDFKEGSGLYLQCYDSDTFGAAELVECVVRNSVIVGSRNVGLAIQKFGTVQPAGGNIIENNILLDNNLVADVDDAARINRNLEERGTMSPANIYTSNHANQTGGDVNTATFYINSVLKDAADFNAYQASNTNNSNTVTRIDGDGIPRTGADIEYGTLYTLPVTAKTPDIALGEDLLSGSYWSTTGTATLDSHGIVYDAFGERLYKSDFSGSKPADGSDVTLSGFAWHRDSFDGDTVDVAAVVRDGVNTTVNNIDLFAIDSASAPVCVYWSIQHTMGVGSTVFETKMSCNESTTLPQTVGYAFLRRAVETTPAWPLDYRLTLDDIDGVATAGTDIIGAYASASIAAPVVPNIVNDDFGNTYTEAEASARLGLYFFTDGTVTDEYSATVAVGDVISQVTEAGTSGTINQAIAYSVSLGPGSASGGMTATRRRRR